MIIDRHFAIANKTIFTILFIFSFLQVETALALGATPREATLQQMRRSLGIALSPAIDNAKTQGLINLPGAMTGLIMAGASPLQAVQMQIVLKNVIMAASTVSVLNDCCFKNKSKIH
jgi:putative ABC transport system permease protein